MISQEAFAQQLQLSDPQTVAGAFSYFQQVIGREQWMACPQSQQAQVLEVLEMMFW